ncbi:MAG: EamA family transporter [Pseudomonadota bacterium]
MFKKKLFAGLLFAVLLDTAGQLLWKLAASKIAHTNIISSVIANPIFWIVVIIFIVQLFNWLFVLEHADLSYAQPITSLSYVSVCIISAWQFGEHIGVLKIIGIILVLFGVLFLNHSNAKKEP